MDLNNWLIFVQIVDMGGLSAASRRLGMPKSTLSRRLARLEDDLGARLLHRRGRAFELTDAGRLLYQEAQLLEKQVTHAEERLAMNTQSEGGTLRMTAPKAPGGQFLGIWLAEFIQLHPHIHIELDLSDQIINIFERGYDLALRVGPLTDSTLVARRLGKSERMLVAAPGYTEQHGQPTTPSELIQHRCIGFGEQRSGLSAWTLTRGKQTQRVNFNPALRINDMSTALCITQAAAGITMIPAFICRESLEDGTLQRILPQWFGPTAEFYLVYPERELMPKRVRLLINFLARQAKKENWRLSLAHERPE
ncbi:MAG TPA: LysR family transcriptional regulator [Gammaproteobacteria bacterium]|nr:LysR family transcriptional regulator [Gammaproteobacteria bacterium]